MRRPTTSQSRRPTPATCCASCSPAYGPAVLILIDEWVAYARQLSRPDDLPAGSFETQFTFAQALTESAKPPATACWWSRMPASDDPRTHGGGGSTWKSAGPRAARRWSGCSNVVGRIADDWRPATALRSRFEIVRRRLFEEPDAAGAGTTIARRGARVRRALPATTPDVPAGVPRPATTRADQGGVPDPPGNLRPALRGLVDAGEVPAHPRRAAADGAVIHALWVAGDPVAADHARHRADRTSRP